MRATDSIQYGRQHVRGDGDGAATVEGDELATAEGDGGCAGDSLLLFFSRDRHREALGPQELLLLLLKKEISRARRSFRLCDIMYYPPGVIAWCGIVSNSIEAAQPAAW